MVAEIVDLKLKRMPGVKATSPFVAALVELVYNQLMALGMDLEMFARHASRTEIQLSDVYMVTRKNPVLTKALRDFEKSRSLTQANDSAGTNSNRSTSNQ